jgi:hypothetical protein
MFAVAEGGPICVPGTVRSVDLGIGFHVQFGELFGETEERFFGWLAERGLPQADAD